MAQEGVTDLGLDGYPRLPLPPPTVPPWEEGLELGIHLRLQGGGRRTDPPERLLEDALTTIRAFGRLDSVFYTDGSVEGGVENGASAVVETVGDVGHPTFLEEWCQKGPRYASSFETEAHALLLCVQVLAERQCHGRFLICSDSLSALSALRKGELKDHPTLAQVVSVLKSIPCEVLFQWVPGHCGLPGNEKADQVAREAALAGRRDGRSQTAPISLKAARLSIERGVTDPAPQHERVRQVYQGPLRHPQGLSRKEEVLLARLRSGHTTHLAAYKGRVQGSDETCARCLAAPETLAHFLGQCEATEARRVRIFGNASPPLSVLSGDPQKVLQYCRELGLL